MAGRGRYDWAAEDGSTLTSQVTRTLGLYWQGDLTNMSAAHTRPSASLAPWAEIVPDAPWPMTVDDLMYWPDDDG